MAFEIALRTIWAITFLVVAALCGWGTYVLAKDGDMPSYIFGSFVAFCLTVAALCAAAACMFYNV
jgi:hypothetical protein